MLLNVLNFELVVAFFPAIIYSITYPPSFTELPPRNAVFIPGEAIKLPCVAIGAPAPKYVWYKNGKYFNWAANTGRYTKWPDQGTLVIAKPGTDDDGIYQCYAYNDFGTAQSNMINVRRAEIGDFDRVDTTTIRVRHGDSVRLVCNVPLGYPPPVVTWQTKKYSQIQYIKETNRRATDINGYLYIAAAIPEDDETLYTCVANNEVMRHQTNGPSYRIKVYGESTNFQLKSLYSTPRTEVVTAGESLRLKCIFGGYPEPQYTWFKDGKEPIELPNVKIQNLGTMLEIDPITVEAAGEYRCQGSNEPTPITKNMQYTVRVKVRPTLVEKPEDTTVPVNGSVIFRCTATGDPPPQIRWTVNGKDPSLYLDGVRKTLQGNVMHLNNLTVKDTAVIQCNASNAFGYDFVNAYVNVMREPPYFIKPPQAELRVVDGHEVIIFCQTFSAPKALISWTKNGRPINGGRYRSLTTGDLHITSAAITDSGVYECTATNPFGSRKAAGRLFVRRRTSIVLAPIDTQVYEGQVVKFVCTAETDPTELQNLKISWYKDDNLIEPDLTPRIQQIWFDYSLVLSGAEPRDTGQYRCNASNGLDYAVASASLLVQGRPEKAIRVEINCVEFIKDELALVSWYPGSDNYAPIMEYIVEYSTQYERYTWYPAEIFNYTGLVQSTSIKVVLRPAILYRFRIRTKNRVGVSLPSVETRPDCGIPPRVPESNPTELYVYGSKRNNLIIKWTTMPYIEHYGSNLGYILKVRCLNCDIIPVTAVNNTVIGDWRTDTITMTSFLVGTTVYEIETYKQFRVSIQSQNEKGESIAPPTVSIGYSGEAVPTVIPPAPTLVSATSKGAVLQWRAITQSEFEQVNGFFRGYRLEWCDAALDTLQCDKQTRFQDYILRIPNTPIFYSRRRRSFIDQKDQFPASAYSEVDTHLAESVLERYLPEGFEKPSHSSTICRMSSKKNVSCPGTGRFPRAAQSPSIMSEAYEHNFGRWPRAVQDFPNMPTFNWGDTLNYSLTGVPGNASIRVWLRILNTRFAGPMSPVLNVQTLEGIPGPVANLKATTIGVTYADIVWTTPAEPNGIVLGYEFEAMELKGLEMGFGFRFPPLRDGAATQHRLPGLRPNTSYRITVWPFTSAGTGVDTFIDFATAPSDVAPNAPNFVVTQVGVTNFTIMYEPSHTGIPGTVFFVQYRQPGVVHWLESTRTFVNRIITISGLMSDTSYEVRVVATNGEKLSTATAYRLIHTLGGPGPGGLAGQSGTWFIIVCVLLFAFIAILILLILIRRRRLDMLKGKAAGPEVAPLVASPEYAQPMNGDENIDSLSPEEQKYPAQEPLEIPRGYYGRPPQKSYTEDGAWSPDEGDGMSYLNDRGQWDNDGDIVHAHDSDVPSPEEETEMENSYVASGSDVGSNDTVSRLQPIHRGQTHRDHSLENNKRRVPVRPSSPRNDSSYSQISGDPKLI